MIFDDKCFLPYENGYLPSLIDESFSLNKHRMIFELVTATIYLNQSQKKKETRKYPKKIKVYTLPDRLWLCQWQVIKILHNNFDIIG